MGDIGKTVKHAYNTIPDKTSYNLSNKKFLYNILIEIKQIKAGKNTSYIKHLVSSLKYHDRLWHRV